MSADEDLQGRLRTVAKRYSQSEIARRTGTWVSNVHHYLNGTRVPADFCIALVNKLGVSGNWLMTGEGAPYTAEQAQAPVPFAEDVHKLARSLDAASRLRFGELARGANTRALAEINAALDAHGDAQERVSALVAAPLIELVDSARAAKEEHDHGRRDALGKAAALMRTARLLLRLTDDPARVLDVGFIETSLAIRESRFADALVHARRCFLMSFSVIGPGAPAFIDAASTCATAASRLGYIREARVVLDTGLAMARAAGNDPEFSGFEDVFRAFSAAETGTIAGMHELASIGLARLGPRYEVSRLSGAPLVQIIGLYSGAITFEQAFDSQPQTVYLLRHLLQWAAWLEDARRLRKLVNAKTGDMKPVPEYMRRLYDRWREAARFVLRATWDQPRGLWREYAAWDEKADSSGAPERDALVRKIRCAQIARLCGETKPAAEMTLEAQKLLQALPAGMDPPLLERAVHYRNALALGATGNARTALKRLRDDARRWFAEMTANGYACFSGFGV